MTDAITVCRHFLHTTMTTTTPLLDGCSDSCGWTAAVIAALAYGTYGVPIKATKHMIPDLNPLVFQSYKTCVMLVMAPPVVLLLGGLPLRFSPWGILSGLLWVLGGTGGVVAVRWAGMAVAVGTWASVMIGVNFVWGILIFDEPFASMTSTVAAFGLLTVGLVGMSHFGAPEHHPHQSTPPTTTTAVTATPLSSSSFIRNTATNNDIEGVETTLVTEHTSLIPSEDASTLVKTSDSAPSTSDSFAATTTVLDDEPICIGNGFLTLTKRSAGVLAAVFNGLMSGSSLIPMHYAALQHNIGGAHYMISYAGGAAIANLALWALYFVALVGHCYGREKKQALSWRDAIQRAKHTMPICHFSKLWFPGCAAGT